MPYHLLHSLPSAPPIPPPPGSTHSRAPPSLNKTQHGSSLNSMSNNGTSLLRLSPRPAKYPHTKTCVDKHEPNKTEQNTMRKTGSVWY